MGKRFLSVETNACAIQSVYQPYFFCTPPIGRQTGLAAVGTLSAVTCVTYFVASSILFVFEQFALFYFLYFGTSLLRAMSASAFPYSMPMDTLELQPHGLLKGRLPRVGRRRSKSSFSFLVSCVSR